MVGWHCRIEPIQEGQYMRISKPLIAAALAISMCSTPVLAQSAAPLSVAARSGAATKDSNQLYNSYLLPALVIIAVLAAAILISNNHDNRPSSP
jgi:NADH:ubiquinone oxidoreductase subunit 6 (subunit J)